jgi:hypothetical protein
LKKRFSTACALTLGERSFGTKPVFTQGVESEVDVATALTRAPGALALPLDRERDLEKQKRENAAR